MDTRTDRYSRHELLAEVGPEGQKRICSARILVLGAGGLGSAALVYLASSGVRSITVIDGDTVDVTNLQRQVIHTMARVGMNKAESARIAIEALNPEVQVRAVGRILSEPELQAEAAACDILLDCTDNSKTRYMLNRIALRLKKPLVTAGVCRFDGQITVLDFRQPATPCYACLFPEREGVDEKASRFGVFAPLVGMLGALQAGEALKVAGGFCTPACGKVVFVDGRTLSFWEMKARKNPRCPVCGQRG